MEKAALLVIVKEKFLSIIMTTMIGHNMKMYCANYVMVKEDTKLKRVNLVEEKGMSLLSSIINIIGDSTDRYPYTDIVTI